MPVPGYGPNTPPVAILKPISAALAAPGRLAKEALAATRGDSSAISGAVEAPSSKLPIVALVPFRGNLRDMATDTKDRRPDVPSIFDHRFQENRARRVV